MLPESQSKDCFIMTIKNQKELKNLQQNIIDGLNHNLANCEFELHEVLKMNIIISEWLYKAEVRREGILLAVSTAFLGTFTESKSLEEICQDCGFKFEKSKYKKTGSNTYEILNQPDH